MSKRIEQWTEQDLVDLIGQPESFRQEFKSGTMFDGQHSQAIDTLSKAVSAFANAEGGTIVVGIAEKKRGNEGFAGHMDGVDLTAMPLHRLQQMVEQSVSPRLQGLRFKAIKLTDKPRSCVIIHVPEGSTAYQARDLKYYGRSEFESKAMADHEIRTRMLKGQIRQARLEVRRWLSGGSYKSTQGDVTPAQVDVAYGEATHLRALEEAAGEVGDITGAIAMSTFSVGVRNVAERTIAALTVEITTNPLSGARFFIGIEQGDVSVPLPRRYRWPDGERIHPGECVDFPPDPLTVIAGDHWDGSDTVAPILWTVYVEDGPPTSGEIDFGDIGFVRE